VSLLALRFGVTQIINGGIGKITDTESFLMGFAIPKEANNPDNASKFILYWLQKEWATKAAMANACFSARPDVESHPIVAEAKEFLMNSTSAHKPYDGLMGDLPMWWTDVFHPVNNSLTFGTITPEEFIAEIKALTIEYWQDKKYVINPQPFQNLYRGAVVGPVTITLFSRLIRPYKMFACPHYNETKDVSCFYNFVETPDKMIAHGARTMISCLKR